VCDDVRARKFCKKAKSANWIVPFYRSNNHNQIFPPKITAINFFVYFTKQKFIQVTRKNFLLSNRAKAKEKTKPRK